MRYRAEIDGLRAVAVVPVVLFHAGFPLFSGGFVGVDVFFVISGYLITGIILSELGEGRFSLVGFYERRARRILPALFLVMAACAPFAWLWLTPRDLKDFAESVVAVSTFSSNILFWRESGYFAPATELKPLLHTWSLAVEEQYYILFPLFLLAMWRLGRQWIAPVLAVVFLASLGLSHWAAYHKPDAGFYLLPTRGWELLTGVFAALYMGRAGAMPTPKPLAAALGLVGLGLIGFAIFAFDSSTPFPSLYALVPTIGALLVILFAGRETIAGRILGNPLFVGVGLISYSAYLWHQPLLAFAKYRGIEEPSPLVLAVLSASAFALAYPSWRFVERPFRRKGVISRRAVVAAAGVAASLFIAFGAVGVATGGFDKRVRNGRLMADLDVLMEPNYGLSAACNGAFTLTEECRSGPTPIAVLWGDSYAMHLAQALRDSPTEMPFRQFTIPLCRPIAGMSVVGGENTPEWAQGCVDNNAEVMTWLGEQDDVKYVVVSSLFTFSHLDFWESGRRKEYDVVEITQRFLDTLEAIKAMGKTPVVISPPPKAGGDLGGCFVKTAVFELSSSACDFGLDELPPDALEARAFLSAVADAAPVIWLDELLCPDGRCPAALGDAPLYRDEGHLSQVGSSRLGATYDLSGRIIERAESYRQASALPR